MQGKAGRDPTRLQKNQRGSSINADLDDLEYVAEVGQVPQTNKTGRPPAGRPPKQANKDVRKSHETGSILAKLKNESEKSKNFLEKQALAEQKRK